MTELRGHVCPTRRHCWLNRFYLDRFDGFLFTLPAVFYLMMVLEPWVSAAPK